jgi:hypothetical protein
VPDILGTVAAGAPATWATGGSGTAADGGTATWASGILGLGVWGANALRVSAGVLTGAGPLLKPVEGRVTSLFGPRVHPVTGGHRHHDGLDLAAPAGTPIRAAGAGVVSFAGQQGGYGNLVVMTTPVGCRPTTLTSKSRVSPRERSSPRVRWSAR